MDPWHPPEVGRRRRWTRLVDRHGVEVVAVSLGLLLGTSAWQWRTSDPASALVATSGFVVALVVGLVALVRGNRAAR